MAKFSRQHYVEMARIIGSQDELNWIYINDLMQYFKKDNPNFSSQRFLNYLENIHELARDI